MATRIPPAYARALRDRPDLLDAALAMREHRAKANVIPTPLVSLPATAPVPTPLATTPPDVILLDDAALETWANNLTTRIGLQAELTWVGLNDGYQDAGGNDVAIPYLGLYWILGPVKTYHCADCPAIAMGSPYDPPGKGPHTIYQSPGDGQTQCGAGCHCWLEYGLPQVSVPQNYVWRNGVFPGPGRALPEDDSAPKESPYGIDRGVTAQTIAGNYSWGEAALLNPESEAFNEAQRAALDLFRAKWLAWEDVRGSLPQAPDMFAQIDGAQSIETLDAMWNLMSQKQRDTLLGLQEAIGDWNTATADANAEAMDLARNGVAPDTGDATDNPDVTSEDSATLAELDNESIQLFGFGGIARAIGGAFGKGAGRAGGGHGGEIGGSGRHALFGPGHKLAGSERGAGKEKPMGRGRGKGAEEQAGHGGRTHEQNGERVKSPNEGAVRRLGPKEQRAARESAKQSEAARMRSAAREASVFRNTHDDSHLRGGGLGQKTPFTRQEFEHALGHLAGLNKIGAEEGVNRTGIATLNGHRYLVKRVTEPWRDPMRQGIRETEQQAKQREALNEIHAARILHAVGMKDMAPSESYMFVARTGLIRKQVGVYSVQRLAPEKPLADKPWNKVSKERLAAFDRANAGQVGVKRMLAEYLTGPVDSHEGNVLFDQATGHVRLVDFGRSFAQGKSFDSRGSAIVQSVLRSHGTSQRDIEKNWHVVRGHETAKVAIDHATIRSITAHAARIASMARYSENNYHIMQRLGVLQKLLEVAHPTMADLERISDER